MNNQIPLPIFNRKENEEESLQDREKFTKVVSNSLKKRDYLKMTKVMQDFSKELNQQEAYVFVPEYSASEVFVIGLLLLLTAGFGYMFLNGYHLWMYAEVYHLLAMIEMLVPVGIAIINLSVILHIIKGHNLKKRFKKYAEYLQYKTIGLVEDISGFVSMPSKKVIKDLSTAVTNGWIPEGHFGTDNVIFITSDESYRTYIHNQSEYDSFYREQADEEKRKKDRDSEINKIIIMGERYAKQIHTHNNAIKDEGISRKLDRMEKVVSNIFYEVDLNPSYASDLGLILENYLPMLDKLLQDYIEIGKSRYPNYKVPQRQIEETIDAMDEFFEKTLNQFYQNKEKEIAESIQAMKDLVQAEEVLKGNPIKKLMKKYDKA